MTDRLRKTLVHSSKKMVDDAVNSALRHTMLNIAPDSPSVSGALRFTEILDRREDGEILGRVNEVTTPESERSLIETVPTNPEALRSPHAVQFVVQEMSDSSRFSIPSGVAHASRTLH